MTKNRIRELRAFHGLRYGDWARKADINVSVFSLVLTGKRKANVRYKHSITDALNSLTNSHYVVGDVFPTNGEPANEPHSIRKE